MPAKLSDDHKTVRIFVPVTEDVRDRFKAECDKGNVTMAEIVRGFMARFRMTEREK